MGLFLFLVLALASSIALIPFASAHCPLCTAATGAAVAATRFYGVDDLIVGLLIGAFILSTALWFNNILVKRNKGENYFAAQGAIIVILSLVSTMFTFYLAGLFGINMLWGINKLALGMVLGLVIAQLAFVLSNTIKRARGKVLFPFQSIILPLLLLILVAIIFYFAFL